MEARHAVPSSEDPHLPKGLMETEGYVRLRCPQLQPISLSAIETLGILLAFIQVDAFEHEVYFHVPWNGEPPVPGA